MKYFIGCIIFLTIPFCAFSRNMEKDLLDNASVKSYCNYWKNIDKEILQLGYKNTAISSYIFKLNHVTSAIGYYVFNTNYDINSFIELYYEFIETDIPVDIHNIYTKYGLKNGHKSRMTIFLGTFISQIEEINLVIENKEFERQKIKSVKKILSKNDLKIIKENLNDLPNAIY